MSSQKTPYLNLHKWVGSDPWRRSENNENNQKLDDKAKALDESMEAATLAAGNAVNTANEAKTTADGIDAKATDALTQSGAAVETANAANETADLAAQDAATALTAANDAVTTAEAADATANQVRDEFDQVVAEAGSSNPEVVNARGEFPILKDRLDATTQQLAETANKVPWKSFRDYGAKGDYDPSTGIGTDDTQSFVNAIQTNAILVLKDGKYKITSSIYLKSNLTIIGIGNPVIYGIGVTDVFKTDGATNYNNIRLVNVGIDAGKIPNDDNIRVCAQFYNVQNLSIEKCRFYNASAAIGLDGCLNVWIDKENIIEGMFQQTNNASVKAGVYGYGVVVNESTNVWIENNVLGSEGVNKQIDRHAIYVSNHGVLGEVKNSRKVFVKGNSIVQKSYATDVEMVTGFEYVLKSIGGTHIQFENNTSFGGSGAIFLAVNYINGGLIKVKNNKFYDLLKTAVLITSDPTPSEYYFEKIEIEDNYFEIKGEYARGINGMNFKEIVSKRNTFVSTIADATLKNPCYYIKRTSENNNVQATKFISEDNYIKGFKQLGYINKVDQFVSDDVVENFPTADGVWNPFTYADAVSFKKTKIRFVKNTYKFKKENSTGLVGLTYFDDDFNSEITCLSVSPVNWVNSKGDKVVGTSTTRPNPSTLHNGFKFWEQDLSRFAYFSGVSWNTTNIIIPSKGTTSEILAINAGTDYTGNPIYNTDTKKPYWWDAYSQQWKDATGTALV